MSERLRTNDVVGQIVRAILEWLTGLWREDKKANDAPDVPSHIRERFSERVRKHPGGFRGLDREK